MTIKWPSRWGGEAHDKGRALEFWEGAGLVCDPDPVIEHLGGVMLPLSGQCPDANTSALVGREATIYRIAAELNEVIESSVDAAIAERFAEFAVDFREHSERYLPPYEFPQSAATENGELLRDDEDKGKGRPAGGTNVGREFFWEQYRNGVDGMDGLPRMQRPYRKTHLQARTNFTYKAFIKYLDLWGPPPGYAAPGE